MQTFLPYESFPDSFKVLDQKRLGKQRVEAFQILNVLTSDTKIGWRNHPAVKMWKGYENTLMLYHDFSILEWISRGYRNNMQYKIFDGKVGSTIPSPEMPWWIGNENFHRSHRARLIAKNENFYLTKFPNDKDFNDGKYFWPDNETKTFKVI